jgi:FkbM family methyltransferase
MTTRTVLVETAFGSFEGFEGDHITEHLGEFGAYQRSDLAMLLSFVRPGDCVLDIGAHIGTFSVPLGKAVGETGRVISFEPVPEHFELLRRNISRNNLDNTVQPVNAAVGNASTPLYINRVTGNSGATNFSHGAGDPMNGIPVIALDTWWGSRPGLPAGVQAIKIDVEGMEHEALSSAAKIIDESRPVVHFEVFSGRRELLDELSGFFSSRGYQFFMNRSFRDSPTDAFRLARLRRVGRLAVTRRYLFDVVAVHPDSPRWPGQASGAWATDLVIARIAARARAGDLRRLVRGAAG